MKIGRTEEESMRWSHFPDVKSFLLETPKKSEGKEDSTTVDKLVVLFVFEDKGLLMEVDKEESREEEVGKSIIKV
ncbi:hypothetical protein SCA6_012054 [Theobroma cacao]